jgi:3',5'-cyclic-AMP phosphodiesterase
MRVQIERIDEQPIREVQYLNASSRGGTEVERLAILRATLAGPLADQLDALIACSDLQGISPGPGGRSDLLGIHIAEVLEELAFDEMIPRAARTGVLLAGDLYSVPAANKRGGYGDVSDVWVAFAERFAWVAGVAGNHDDITRVATLGEKCHLLDGTTAALDGLKIGGVGGIIGNPRKPGRRSEEEQLDLIESVGDSDIVLLHEGPQGDPRQLGNSSIRKALEKVEIAFTICGHNHWSEPLAMHPTGQILNVDTRVVVLVAPT